MHGIMSYKNLKNVLHYNGKLFFKERFVFLKVYLDLVKRVLENGELRKNRTGVDTLSIFGDQIKVDLREGFPLLTTKKVYFHSVLRELLWFISGETNIYKGLHPHTKIWDAWASKDGELGPVYGYQWRFWERFSPVFNQDLSNTMTLSYKKSHIDQLEQALKMIKEDPFSRRIIISAWNVADLDKMALQPCHVLIQFNVSSSGYLDCQLYQRSADIALGVPFNIASYSLLLMMIAQECRLTPRYFIHSFGDLHAYTNHVEGLKLQCLRHPKPLPSVHIADKPVIQIKYEDVYLKDYVYDDAISFPVAV